MCTVMKKIAKAFLSLLLVVGLTAMCGTVTSCKSDTMYKTKKQKNKVIHKNYKMRGDNGRNGSTYRTY